jgi:hypothetical protein
LGSSSTALAARFPKMAIICSMLSMPHPLTPSRTEPMATTERKISANTKRKMLAGGEGLHRFKAGGHIRFDSPQLLLRSRGKLGSIDIPESGSAHIRRCVRRRVAAAANLRNGN